MHEVVEVELERPIALDAHDVPEGIDKSGLTVTREAHDLALVAVRGKSQPLRDHRVEEAERMREMNRILHGHLIGDAPAPHRADEVAHPIDGENGSIVEGRHEEGAGQVRAMMLDAMELCARDL